ncbi:MAG: ECF-type sigma factor [Acidobacteriota bacterium]
MTSDDDTPGEITRLLADVAAGREGAEDELLPLVYAELRRIARSRMAREGASHTLQPTALVHEAYLRLSGDDGLRFENRRHFFGAAAEAMRRILVDAARRRQRIKRGGDQQRVDLESDLLPTPDVGPAELLELDDLLDKLERQDASIATVFKLRHFVGMTVDEVADGLEVSPRTVARQWNTGRAWLKRELGTRSG